MERALIVLARENDNEISPPRFPAHHENRTPTHRYSEAKGGHDSTRQKLPAGVGAQELLTRFRVAKAEPFINAPPLYMHL